MNMKSFRTRVDEQITKARKKFGLRLPELKFATDTFKPDSPKLDTVVTVEIGWKDNESKYVRTIRYFYSPRQYRFSSVSKLKSNIEQYLKNQSLTHF